MPLTFSQYCIPAFACLAALHNPCNADILGTSSLHHEIFRVEKKLDGTRKRALTFAYMVDSGLHDLAMQGLESEFGTSRSQWLNDAGDVIADEDEPCHLAVALHCPPQRILSILQGQYILLTMHHRDD